MNALRHGLTAQHVTVFDETEEDFRRFHPELMRVLLQPKGGMEGQLSERAVICAWRLRRVYRIETGMLSKVRKSWAPAPHDQRTARNAVSRAAVGRISQVTTTSPASGGAFSSSDGGHKSRQRRCPHCVPILPQNLPRLTRGF